MNDVLRVIDFGQVSALRSQTLWHAVAYGVSAGAPVTLSFARPSAPYVCLGYLMDAAEVDHDYCRAHGLPVYRRMVGGGPVYLDDRQLLFQIALPVSGLSPSRPAALQAMLEPAVAAFRAAGVDAGLDDGEICLGDRKICGHGAGQIDDAVVVCGNLIEAFDHEGATRVLAVPEPAQRSETLRLMRRYVTATPGDPQTFMSALTGAYASALGLPSVLGELSAAELTRTAELDRRFGAAQWLSGPRRALKRPGGGQHRQVKVRAGIWTLAAWTPGGARLVISVVKGVVDRVTLTAPDLDGQARQAERALAGIRLAAVGGVLSAFGTSGRELAAVLASVEGRQ
jgi:lipoate-protein ligase A